jgi:hypothetical protein
MLTILL